MNPVTVLNLDEHRVLHAITQGTAPAETGEEFFRALAHNLASALQVRFAWVARFLPDDQLETLAFWDGQGYFDNFVYPVVGTPCETVLSQGKLLYIGEGLRHLYPNDRWMQDYRIESYMGVPIVDVDGRLLGHLSVADPDPMPGDRQYEDIFRLFATRAAAELRRQNARRSLARSEEQLRRIVESTQDMIVAFDRDLRVRFANPAAAAAFDHPEEAPPGTLDQLLCLQACRLVVALGEQLSDVQPSLLVPQGLTGKRRDGVLFPVEGTLSCFALEGESHFVLIMRDLSDRAGACSLIEKLVSTGDGAGDVDPHPLGHQFNCQQIVGSSAGIRGVVEQIKQVSGTNATVLVTGETGTGKELVARAIHDNSARRDRAFVRVNCAALPPALIESELFGHEKGAFTGAIKKRLGRFSVADGGTLFLDEVGELPPDTQVKLLRVLQEGEFERVGSTRTQRVNVRVVVATNRNLRAAVTAGEFRQDLYYRLDVFPIVVPPLRERREDAWELAQVFAERFAQELGRRFVLDEACRSHLTAYDWPGNVRELRNVIERAAIVSTDGRLRLDCCIGHTVSRPEPNSSPAVMTAAEIQALEKNNIERALAQTGGRVFGEAGAAALLELPPTTLASRIKALGIAKHPTPEPGPASD